MREGTGIEKRHAIYRHPVIIRVAHWINALCLAILLMSGLQIFNAHPALYWGSRSHFENPSLEIKAVTADALRTGAATQSAQSLRPQPETPQATDNQDDDAASNVGVVTLGSHVFKTTGWLGYSTGPDGDASERAFPSWITLPGEQDLATGRRWHFTFAWLLVLNGLAYLVFTFASGHIRDLWANASEWRDIPHSIWQHICLRFPKGEEARHYNVLQKLAYLAIIFIVLPVIILAGMTMSPGLDARFPFLLSLFGGRQSARTIHFILAFGLVGFAFIHVAMVILSGFFNNMRSMITGRYVISSQRRDVS
jgi:thiosulfate reductase cytochrome b subunit